MKKLVAILFLIVNNTFLSAATFSSLSSGDWSTSTTWVVTGFDANGIPDADDDVIVNSGHSISLSTTGICKTLLVQATGAIVGNAQAMSISGNITNSGSVTNVSILSRATSTITSTTPITGSAFSVVTGTLTISAGTKLNFSNNITLYGGTGVYNFGEVYTSTKVTLGGFWINEINSRLTVNLDFSGAGVLTATATGNTVAYYNNNAAGINIKNINYYNLILAGKYKKTFTSNTIVLNDFTISSVATSTIDLNNFDLTVGGNWLNSNDADILNQNNITFNGSGTQTITRANTESFKNLILSGTGTVLLAKDIKINQNLTINSGTFDASASNYSVNILGNLTNNGTINARSNIFKFSGAAAQTLSGSSTTNFYDVISTNSAGVSVASNSKISNILTVTTGNFGTSGSGAITIPATAATSYGRIGPVGGSLTGTGWKIESYIAGPAPKGWQWLSSPINNNTLADWDNDPRFYMSGVGGNDGNAGNFKSVRIYNTASGAYTNITTTSTILTPGKGFMVWMADNNTTGLTAPLIYNSVGTPNYGNITFPITSGGTGNGYNLVGNPYGCPITYSSVVAASGNLNSSFLILLESGAYSTDPNGGVIAPNQGFFCNATSSGNILFTEACKNTSSLPNILRGINPNSLTFNVYNNVNGLGGNTTIDFNDNFTDNFDIDKDLSFLASPYDDADNIWSTSADNVMMLKNTLNGTDYKKDVSLTIKSGVYGLHHLKVNGLTNFSKYNTVLLEDLKTGKLIDLMKNQDYSFYCDDVQKDYHFVVHFSNNKNEFINSNSINTNQLNENTSIYNTSSGIVIKFDMLKETPVKISILNLSGQEVISPLNLNVTNDRIEMPLDKSNGLYLLIIQSNDEQITRKIIY